MADNEFTTRVKLGTDGIYRWRSPVRLESDKPAYKLALTVCAVVTVASIGLCAIISVDFMISVLPAILGTVAAAILLFLLVVKLGDSIMQKYKMSDAYVQLVGQKEPISYNEIDEIVVNPLYVELYAKGKSTKIYAPNEDFLFVKDYIANHTLGHAVVTFDRYGMTSTGEE